MGGFGLTEILVILFIILLLFGAKKIPELMRGVGKGINEFKESRNSGRPEDKDDLEDKPLRNTDGSTRL